MVWLKPIIIALSISAFTAVLISSFTQITFLKALFGGLALFSGLPFLGHVITFDDDLPGGWSNPDGSEPFPYRELIVKGLIFFTCLGLFYLT